MLQKLLESWNRKSLKRITKKLPKQKSRRSSRYVRLRLEELEPLIAPADLYWTAMGGDSNWDTVKNWSTNTKPQNGDALFFDKPAVNSTDNMAGLQLAKLTVTSNYNTGIITLNNDLTVTTQINLAAGTITGSTTLTLLSPGGGVNGQFNWSGGTMSGSGSTVIGGASNNATLNISDSVTLDARKLNIVKGSGVNWTAGVITMDNAAQFVNDGTFSVTTAGFFYTGDTSSTLFKNDVDGSFTVNIPNAGLNTEVTSFVKFNNLGTVTLTSGSLQLFAGSYSTGTFNLPKLGFDLYLDGPAVHTLDGATVKGGAIVGGSLVMGKNSDTHVTILNTVNVDYIYDTQNTTTTLDGGGTLIVNKTYGWYGGPWSGSGSVQIGTFTNNNASLNINSGPVGGGAIQMGRTLTNYGTVTWAAKVDIQVQNGANINNNKNNNKNANFIIQVDQKMFNGGGAGQFTNDTNATLKKTGAGGNTVIDIPFKRNPGDDVIDGGGAGKIQFKQTIVSAGTTEVDGAGIDFLAGFEQDAGSTFFGNSAHGVITVSGGNLVQTGGYMTVSPSGNLVSVIGQYQQSGGTVTVNAGASINVTDQYILSGGTVSLRYGSITATNGFQVLAAGLLEGFGGITTNTLTNSGTVNPNSQANGAIGITGNYTQTTSGVLNEEIMQSGGSPGSTYLSCTGTASLHGTLNVTSLTGPISPFATFTVLTYGSVIGNWDTMNLPPLTSGHWIANEGSTVYTISAVR